MSEMAADSNSAGRDWTVWGIVELGCWIGHFPGVMPTGHDAEDCLDAHVACNITHIVWNLGRSVLAYHSSLPQATCAGDLTTDDAPPQTRALRAMYRERCQLRAALDYAESQGLTIYGRLCMNRHYNPGSAHRSEFARNHPEWCELRKDAWLDPTRLCYAIPEYRQERIAILAEAARIGCAGVCLDFCRQPPAVRYHPALVVPYREKSGNDPRRLSLAHKDEFLDWCRFRADAVTALLHELREALDAIRRDSGRKTAVRVRIPNDGFEANLIAGFDVRRWCRERLIDELALSELRWLAEYQRWDDRPYIELGAETGIRVYASSSCLPMQAPRMPDRPGWSGKVNPDGVNPPVLARRTLRSMEQGAQGISLYQSDTGVRWPGMPQVLSALGDRAALRRVADDPELMRRFPVTPENEDFGIDNHSRPPFLTAFRANAEEEPEGV